MMLQTVNSSFLFPYNLEFLLVYLSHHSSEQKQEEFTAEEGKEGKKSREFVCFKSFIKNDDKIIGSIKMSI